jgi:transcriptional regulator with XRE-family HTH domain
MDKHPQQIIKMLVDIGYTQQEIAQKSNLTQATISRILSGYHQTARLDTYKRLLKLQEIDNGDTGDNAPVVVGSADDTRGQSTENSGDASGKDS